ncbi:Hypothetical predicted protein [Octopus vulgaris]|uniref:Uncharacterized protein n=1 Tax=Octopus vulgaris TaxID=6645 RepID=A0AA36FG53_OCTVU|nr:Hypothetical predicted protein [Octopus vulgaris]
MFDRTKLKRPTETKSISRFATLTPGENIKEKQQKLKEERESKRKQLDDRHWYILQTVADCLQLDKLDVEESILEGTQKTKTRSAHDHFRSERGCSGGGRGSGGRMELLLTGELGLNSCNRSTPGVYCC